jgi:hypothetical protein
MSKSYAALLNQDNKERPKVHVKPEKKAKDETSLEISDLKYCDDDKLLMSVC